MSNIQLERRAVSPKAKPAFVLKPIPKLPERFVRQFKLEEFEAEWEQWRQSAQSDIRAYVESALSAQVTPQS